MSKFIRTQRKKSLENQTNKKIGEYLKIANKAGYLIIGCDNLKGYSKKLYLIIIDTLAAKNSQKIALRHQENGTEVIMLDNLDALAVIKNCKIVGIKNKGISDQIITLYKEN